MSFQERFGADVDVEEFKRKAIALVMESRMGRNALDYYLAELAVDAWLSNFDKNADELEAFIASWDLHAHKWTSDAEKAGEEEPEDGYVASPNTPEEEEKFYDVTTTEEDIAPTPQ